MGESANSLFRRGLISPRAGAKLGVLKSTRAQKSKMAAFDDKSGRSDQGAGRQRGIGGEAGTRGIDRKQSASSPVAGAPSRGGSVSNGKGKAQPVTRNEIDDRSQQGPSFPNGGRSAPKPFNAAPTPGSGKASPSSGGKVGTPKRAKGPIAQRGGQYGGGGRNTQ